MATNALTIPVRGRDLRVIPAERELRPKWVYEDGKRTDKPAVDDKGRPLYGITALIDSDFTGPVDGCRITVATPNLPPVAFGQILHLTASPRTRPPRFRSLNSPGGGFDTWPRRPALARGPQHNNNCTPS